MKTLMSLLALAVSMSLAHSQNSTTFYTLPGGYPGNLTTSIVADSTGCQWIGTGYALIKKNGASYSYITTGDGLPSNSITALFEDSDNNLWIGTTAGISRKSGSVITTFTTLDGLPGQQITGICEDQNNRIWVSVGGGVAVYNDTIWQAFTTADGIPSNDIRDIFCDDQGDIWIGTNGDGLAVYSNNTWNTITSTASFCIYAINQDATGKLFAGGMDPAGNGMLIARFGSVWGTEILSSCGDFVTDIDRDQNGDLWVTWWLRDICKQTGSQWYNFTPTNTTGWTTGLPCMAIDIDNSGLAWVGMYGSAMYPQGLMRLNSNMVSIQPIQEPTFNVYPNPAINCVWLTGVIPDSPYQICDAWGRVLIKGYSHGETAGIDLTALPAGRYIVWIRQDEKEFQLPLIKRE